MWIIVIAANGDLFRRMAMLALIRLLGRCLSMLTIAEVLQVVAPLRSHGHPSVSVSEEGISTELEKAIDNAAQTHHKHVPANMGDIIEQKNGNSNDNGAKMLANLAFIQKIQNVR